MIEALSNSTREELMSLGLQKANIAAELIIQIYDNLSVNPELALELTRRLVNISTRIALFRELNGVAAYNNGEYRLAITELKTAKRINGATDYLPMIADSYRGIGQSEIVLKIASSDEALSLAPDTHAELAIVLASVYADSNKFESAHQILQFEIKRFDISNDSKLKILEARLNFYEMAGDDEHAKQMNDAIEPIRVQLQEQHNGPLVTYDLLEKEA
jgi:tetratricopeptide (TPR) repeat protein